jgi:two-component system repressor protein LuxO
MRAVYDIIRSVAPSKASVFITGESGTGKELAAEALHKASPRAGKPFIALNCGAIPRDLLESEVFGHVKGAFTGATSDRVGAAKLADGGTLFLDEIGEMPLEMQVKLLRFVQTGTFGAVGSSRLERVDVRFVCATNRDPMLEVQAGRFREDLYYRLYVVPVQLPPLRERGDDVLLVARHFLTQFSREERRRFTGFAPEAERMLMAFSWPGNVRQLQNVVRNIVVLHDGPLVTAAMIPPPVNRAVLTSAQAVLPTPPSTPLIDAGPPAPPAAPPPRDHPGMMATPVQLPQSMAVPEAAPEAPPPPPVEPPPPPGPALSRTPLPHPAASHPAASHPAASHPGASRPAAVPDLEVIPLSEMERRMVLAALARTGNDIPRAAALLEVNPSTIYRKVSAWRKGGLLPS